MIGDRWSTMHDEALAAAQAVGAELITRFTGEDLVAITHAMAQVLEQTARNALDDILEEVLLAVPVHTEWRLARLSGLSERTIRRRHELLLARHMADGTIVDRGDGRLVRAS